MLELFQSVVALVDVPAIGVKAGTHGAIVDVYSQPYEAFEVEFFDADWNTLGTASVRPDQLTALEPVKQAA